MGDLFQALGGGNQAPGCMEFVEGLSCYKILFSWPGDNSDKVRWGGGRDDLTGGRAYWTVRVLSF